MRNRIRCARCQTIIESTHRHDFKYCPCETVFIDGGKDYQRMGGNLDDIILVLEDDTEKPYAEIINERRKAATD